MKRIKDLLEQIGLEPERVEMFNMSAAMASQFVSVTKEMTEIIQRLGPNPLRYAVAGEKDQTAKDGRYPKPDEECKS